METHVVTNTFFPLGNLGAYEVIKIYGRVREAIDDLVLYCTKGVIFMPGNEDRNI
jgi:hypothetical protein